MSKQAKIESFNPNDIGSLDNNIYGLPFTPDEASLVILPIPWDVTVSYKSGASKGPEAVFDASFQVDLFDSFVHDAWKLGVAMLPINKKIKSTSIALRKKAEEYIDLYAKGKTADTNTKMRTILKEINDAGAWVNNWIKDEALKQMRKGKLVALLGGDHSTPLGLMQAVAEVHKNFAILHIDAHADLRNAYEGFEFSHASIMYNAIKIKQVSKLVQVGIRDYCEDEFMLSKSSKKITTFYDDSIKAMHFEGKTWAEQCKDIIKALPQKVYISMDIDELDPKYCPNTGTPVPGGFEFDQVVYLVQQLVKSKKQIIAFDINEVSPGKDEWDANVGARLLYKFCNLCLVSNGIKP